MKIELRNVPAPCMQFVEQQPVLPAAEYEARLDALYRSAGCDWVVVYADREHYANLTFLLNFDPRFEEALLVLGKDRRVLVVGNEGLGYVSVLPLAVEVMLCQTMSLGGQTRQQAPRLQAVLAQIGIGAGQRVSVVGWKYLEAMEDDEPDAPAFVPAFFVAVLRRLVGANGQVVDGTALLMHPQDGLRASNPAAQIAVFEWAARACSAAVFGVVRGARPGMSEYAAMQHMAYAGLPMSMHPILTSGKGELNGLRSPCSRRLEYGDAISTAIGYWGSLVCRAGLLLGEPDRSFFDRVAAPYFGAVATWYRCLRLGVSGGDVFAAVAQAFAGSGLRSALNPGHLTSYDEWLHSPIRPASNERLRSGMVFQADIIPTPLGAGEAMNCEDTLALADESLRAEIRSAYPEMWQRIQRRRAFMMQALGLELAEEVLPLSDGAAYLPPFWLASEWVCAVVKEG